MICEQLRMHSCRCKDIGELLFLIFLDNGNIELEHKCTLPRKISQYSVMSCVVLNLSASRSEYDGHGEMASGDGAVAMTLATEKNRTEEEEVIRELVQTALCDCRWFPQSACREHPLFVPASGHFSLYPPGAVGASRFPRYLRCFLGSHAEYTGGPGVFGTC